MNRSVAGKRVLHQYLALSVALAIVAAAAWAAALPRNSVGTRQIKNNAVTSAKVAPNTVGAGDIATGAVTSSELNAGAVTSEDVLNNSLTGDDIDESTLSIVPNADTLDGLSSDSFLQKSQDVVLWSQAASAYDLVYSDITVAMNDFSGSIDITRDTNVGATQVSFPLDTPKSLFGASLYVKSVSYCFQTNQTAELSQVRIYSGETNASGSTLIGSDDPVGLEAVSASGACNVIAMSTPYPQVDGGLGVVVNWTVNDASHYLRLFGAETTFATDDGVA